jgi:5-formyltetrahydrofolate cyclo-ligase
VVSVYWPIKAEPDLRPWMNVASERGVRIVLPVAIALGQPLVFREWRPNTRMARGLWKIPYPTDSAEIVPSVVIAPVVGFDKNCFRLGYGGGFFDRTLARFAATPLVIGVGYPDALLSTIFPQAYDIPMDCIVTGSAPPLRRGV